MRIIRLSVILFFLLTSNIFAKDIYLSCESPTQFKLSFVINDEKKILILNGVEREVVKWTKEYISFWVSDQFKAIQEPRNLPPNILDRISGSYGVYNCEVVKKTLF
tara:strand:+ start:1197 stop:1514 length:318 start_codon:yes stop_codon:yes gene_type:complete